MKSIIVAVRHVIQQMRWRHVRVAFGASIRGRCHFGEQVLLGAQALVRDSTLGSNVILEPDCQVVRSRLGGNNRICSGTRMSDVAMGRYTYVAQRSEITSTDIGQFCSIGKVTCGRGRHPTRFVSTSPVFYSVAGQCGASFAEESCFEERQRIIVGNDVLISDNVFICDGVTIGNGAVVGAGAVVVRDVPDYAVVGGVPARILRYRFSPHAIARLLSIQWWNWPEQTLRECQQLFVNEDVSVFLDWADGFCHERSGDVPAPARNLETR